MAALGLGGFRQMKLDAAAHKSRPWRIHEVVDDFDLADVWALPTPGGPDDLACLAQMIASTDESFMSNPWVRVLFSIRMKLGAWFGLDAETDAPGTWSLRSRLPSDLRDGPRGPDVITLVPFPSVYLTDSEWVAECSSRLVHMVQHVGWVQDGSGAYRGELATLVRPRNRFGKLYMRAIAPFRRFIVSPAQVRSIAREWEQAIESHRLEAPRAGSRSEMSGCMSHEAPITRPPIAP